MRLRGRQLRFLLLTLGAWAGLRAWVLWPEETPIRIAARQARVQLHARTARPEPVEGLSFSRQPAAGRGAGLRQAQPERSGERIYPAEVADIGRLAEADLPTSAPPPIATSPAAPPPATANPLVAVTTPPRRDWEGEAYLFYRPDGRQTSLAAGGQLGGSQIAARVAWRPGGGPIGLALRAYAPVGEKGAEAAAGIDWHPFDKIPIRVSIERRQKLDPQGRSAWSAYTAGGFYRAKGSIELDGYAQAGIVGTQRRDGFVDGALRIGYRLPAPHLAPILGAGIWGAAQPGVARIDIGPRAALRIPAGTHMLSLALDARLRLAGRAAPGSGFALTFAGDW